MHSRDIPPCKKASVFIQEQYMSNLNQTAVEYQTPEGLMGPPFWGQQLAWILKNGLQLYSVFLFLQHLPGFTHIHSLVAEVTMQHTTCSSAAITITIARRLTHAVCKAAEAVGFSVLPKGTLTCRHQWPGDGPTDHRLIRTRLLDLLSHSHLRKWKIGSHLYGASSQSTL